MRKKIRQVDFFEKFGVKGGNREMGLYIGQVGKTEPLDMDIVISLWR